jgi:fatty-acyl-CoA synthase
MCGAPIVYTTLINSDAAAGRTGNVAKVKGLVAGASTPMAMIEGAERVGIELVHVYGLTEAYGPAAVCAKQPGWDEMPIKNRALQMRRQGVPYHLQEDLAVLDPQTMKPVPTGGTTIGEVMFRGNIVMKGYLKNKVATEKALESGWFHTGDLGVVDKDGYVTLKDRSKDIIISGGENISSVEVEEVLFSHPAVSLAAVVALPDGKWGEVPCAFVELKDGATVSSDELLRYCREALPGFKTPKKVIFGLLPKTSTGKIQKFKLRKRVNSASAILE